MSKLYGSIQGSRGAATRMGHSSIKSSVQSYSGSVITYLSYEGDNLMVEVCAEKGQSTSYGRRIFYGTFDDFIAKLERED